jgi:putative SOS response-associated peptidase YedK
MCGRYSLIEATFLQCRYYFRELPPDESDSRVPFTPRCNIAPWQAVPVVVNRDGMQLCRMAWGYRPAWFKPSP